MSAKVSRVGHRAWQDALLQAVESCGPEGVAATDYLRAHRTYVGFQRVGAHVGAIWTPLRSIRINARHFSYSTPLSTLKLMTLIIHEARHLQQGPLIALSVYGELDAWQLEFRVYRRLLGKELPAPLHEILALPLGWDRAVLREARRLMQVYAGKRYRADLLPLYPIHRELAYRLFRIAPAGGQLHHNSEGSF